MAANGYYPWGYGGYGFGAYPVAITIRGFMAATTAFSVGLGYWRRLPRPHYPAPYYGGFDEGSVRIKVKPRNGSVYVDGYFAGRRTTSTEPSSACTWSLDRIASRCGRRT